MIPAWVPAPARFYLAHIEGGTSIRELARRSGCHASTILRRVRRCESRRDDVLVDEALQQLGRHLAQGEVIHPRTKEIRMTPTNSHADHGTGTPSTERLDAEARRVLRRLCENGAVLAVATEMDKAVVVRDTPHGGTTRLAVVDRDIAQAMALKEWIACDAPGRLSRYHITGAGRSALNRLLAEAENAASGFAEAQAPFGVAAAPAWHGAGRGPRYARSDSPLLALARRRDRDGQPFLEESLVRAGERLREDFELAQMEPRTGQNWDHYLTGTIDTGPAGPGAGPNVQAARDRAAGALRDLGPGLGDVALRCCCYLEGLESVEKRLGWSARSGKIVLRIALQRLKRHYENLGEAGGLMG
ncbi:DUF6456 domain-containing protein [Roseovarius salinarum]|uniref:DUF6456 domain-containing protein n=1 Tax=Roseovarius salinarum TaxID=1981892 RepID=UPI000C330448|nr:DUF6456 domain-containing protein [Roseovarius salinarum]